MQTVRYCEIPSYLRKGDFFRSLASDDPDSLIEIPLNKFHQDRHFADNLNEFRNLLETAEFWMLDDIPPGILHFCDRSEMTLWVEWCPRLFSLAIRNGNLPCLKYFHQQGYLWDKITVKTAVQNGQVDCLLYLLMNGCPYDGRICDVACKSNQPTCLALLLLFDVPCDATTSSVAAKLSDAACLRWLHESGCPWNAHTTGTSLIHGQVEPLRYALTRGCPLDEEHLICTLKSQSLECLQYLIESQTMAFPESAYFVALLSGNVPHLQYLFDQGCPMVVPDAHERYYQCFREVEANPNFLMCVEMAVERGWDVPDHFVRYLITQDISSYTKLCEDLGCLAHSSTGEGFLKFVHETDAMVPTPSVLLLKEKDARFIDKMFSKCWSDDFIKQNFTFVKAVYFAIAFGWIPDTPIRDITGISLTHCFRLRIMGTALQYAVYVFCIIMLQLPMDILAGVIKLLTNVVTFKFGRLFWILSLVPMAFVRLCYLLIYPFYSKVKIN